jgi:hypothetical protein
MNTESLSEVDKYTISHLSIIRFFTIWSLLDLFIYYLTNNNRKLELIIHITIFIIINLIVFFYPFLISYI